MPNRSGYGPAVSSGVTTQVEVLIALLAPLALVDVDAALELALTGDDEQPERSADPASPSVSSRRRRVSVRSRGDIGRAWSTNLAATDRSLMSDLRRISVEAVPD